MRLARTSSSFYVASDNGFAIGTFVRFLVARVLKHHLFIAAMVMLGTSSDRNITNMRGHAEVTLIVSFSIFF